MPDGLEASTRAPIHQALRKSTRADHLRLERELNLLGPDLTRCRYGHVLNAFHGFYAPLEAQFRRYHRTELLDLDFALPRRTHSLMKDLTALGMRAVATESGPMPEIRTLSEFAGRLYVVEGAALGGQVLARHLDDKWGLDRDSGAAFFSGAGPLETGRRWTRVLDWLERVAMSGAQPREMIAAASRTFRALENQVAAQVVRS